MALTPITNGMSGLDARTSINACFTKVDTVETGADVTDATNVQAALTGATITGLTSVTSTTFVGSLTGLASLNLPLAGGTLTGTLINSTNGAVSAPVLSLTGTIYASGTATTTKPTLLIEPTGTTSTGWSTGGTLMGANAPSGFAGRIIDLQVNGTSKFSVDANGYFSLSSVQMLAYNGAMYIGSASSGNMNMNPGGTSWWQFNTAGNLGGRSDSVLGWASSGTPGTNDLSLGRASSATLRMGLDHATTATNQTIKAHNVTTGTGANLILSGGTGSVANGVVVISRLPTSNPGAGILWNNAGTPAIGT